MSETDAVLFANEAFYQAFADRDMDAMEATWSQDLEPTCLHPGWQPLIGREAVLKSWLGILANPQSPEIRCWNASAQIVGDMAYVLCFEEIEGQYLVATNVFVHESGPAGRIWRMVHHQSGPTAARPEPEDDEHGPVN